MIKQQKSLRCNIFRPKVIGLLLAVALIVPAMACSMSDISSSKPMPGVSMPPVPNTTSPFATTATMPIPFARSESSGEFTQESVIPSVSPPPTAVQSLQGWRITNVGETSVASSARVLEQNVKIVSYPPKGNIFLSVAFDLKAGNKELDIRDIILTIDGDLQFFPSGYPGTKNYEGTYNKYVGSLSGTFTADGYDISIEIEERPSKHDPRGYTLRETSPWSKRGPRYTLIYVVPSSCIDGTHHFELQIDGSGGVAFTVEPLSKSISGRISPEGEYVVVCEDNQNLSLVERQTGKSSWSYALDAYDVDNVYFGGDYFAVVIVDEPPPLVYGPHKVLLFHRSNAEPLLKEDFKTFRFVTLSNDGRLLAVAGNKEGGWGYYVYLYDTSSGLFVGRLGDSHSNMNGAIFSIDEAAVSANGDTIIVAGYDTVYLFDCTTISEVWRYTIKRLPESRIFEIVTISADGNYIGMTYTTTKAPLKADGQWEYSYSVLMFASEVNSPLWEYTSKGIYPDRLYQCVLSADGSSLLAKAGPNLILFDKSGATPLWTKSMEDFKANISSYALSSNGKLVVVKCDNDIVYLLDRAGKVLWSRSGMEGSVAMSADDKTIAISGNTVHLLNVADGKEVWIFRLQ